MFAGEFLQFLRELASLYIIHVHRYRYTHRILHTSFGILYFSCLGIFSFFITIIIIIIVIIILGRQQAVKRKRERQVSLGEFKSGQMKPSVLHQSKLMHAFFLALLPYARCYMIEREAEECLSNVCEFMNVYKVNVRESKKLTSQSMACIIIDE